MHLNRKAKKKRRFVSPTSRSAKPVYINREFIELSPGTQTR